MLQYTIPITKRQSARFSFSLISSRNRPKVFLSLDYVLGLLDYLHAQEFCLEPSTIIRTFIYVDFPVITGLSWFITVLHL